MEPPGKEAGAQQNGWVWIVVLFFLFVTFLGTKKKPNPSHHFTCISQDQKPGYSGLGRHRQLPRTPQPSGWDWYSCWDQGLGSSQNTTKTMLTVPPCTDILAGFRLNIRDPSPFKIFF